MSQMDNIFIRKAKTEDGLNRVFDVRWAGYKKYFNNKEESIDKYDYAPNVTLLLAEDGSHEAVGTMRILDRRHGKIELDEFIEVDSLIPDSEKPCAEVTRFSFSKHLKSKLIKLLLRKAVFRYCQENQINTMLISMPPTAARDYQRLFLLEDTGPSGVYHHRLLGNVEHHTYKCDIPKTMEFLRSSRHPLYDFFCTDNHSNISMD
jgi:hypothetical protein